jgi:prepilin-type N-terminal cleavage/methylation domain-containing protein
VTLIELLVTIAIMGIAFVALLGAISTVELTIGTTSDDSQLASVARQVGDYIQSSKLVYQPCEGSSGVDYRTALQQPSAIVFPSSRYSISAIQVAQGNGSDPSSYDYVNGTKKSLQAIPVAGCTTDYGVQQIEFTVSTTRQSLSRIVYKRWNQ